jgi:hypothetical protein
MRKEKRYNPALKAAVVIWPSCFDNDVVDGLQPGQVYSVVCGHVRDTKRQDEMINFAASVGLMYLETLLIGGNEMILRFEKAASDEKR